MATKTKIFDAKKMTKEEKYLNKVFLMVRKCENAIFRNKSLRFKSTEIRLMGLVLSAKAEGKRLISTQLAQSLGITRSAVSQIVNRLEEQGVLKRVADDVDKKIAYIEMTEEILSEYKEEMTEAIGFVSGVIQKYGEEKFDTMYQMFDEFMTLLQTEKDARIKAQK